MAPNLNLDDASSLAVAITGASGLVGSALAAQLSRDGHRVIRLVRSTVGDDDRVALWNPAKGIVELDKLEGLDAIVHLAGENIAQGRWTRQKKERILRSRVDGTSNLVQSLSGLKQPPKTFLSGSAIGIYGDRGDEVLDEESSLGSGFLADVCRQWESSAKQAEALGIRVALARTGIVLSSAGGALTKMLPAFRLGAGGRIGSGDQFMSWVSIDDEVGAMRHILMRSDLTGPVNLVAPDPVRNSEFTRELAAILRRPAVMPMPAFGARALFGQMADEALLASTRVVPSRLEASGYRFEDAELGPTLTRLLRR